MTSINQLARMVNTEAPAFNERPDCFVQQPLDETSEVNSLKYSTGPFGNDVGVIGPLALYLHAAIDQTDTNWHVSISEIDANGRKTMMPSYNWLKASHRALDESASRPWEPRHDHTMNVPIVPGEVNEYAIALSHTANLFRAGHRLEIEISSMDIVPGGLHTCSS